MSAIRWEYRQVRAEVSEPMRPEGGPPWGTYIEDRWSKVRGDGGAQWTIVLNEMGADGWELVSERVASGERQDRSVYISFAGTMKRRIEHV
jgi:hypothetical protein